MKNDNFTYTTNPDNGTIESQGYLEITKGNHNGMPARTENYAPSMDRGHLNASSLGGGNHELNVTPQERDLNRSPGAYYAMEQGERDALKSGATVFSEKTAYNSAPKGTAPDAYMVNDTITAPNGTTHTVHLSFSNLSNEEQAEFQQTLDQHTDMLNAPNPGDVGRAMYSPDEYAQLMEETDAALGSVRDEYSTDWTTTTFDPDPTVSATDTPGPGVDNEPDPGIDDSLGLSADDDPAPSVDDGMDLSADDDF